MTLATVIMAAATVVLAGVTVWAILQNRRWNRRAERMRVLPLLRLRPIISSKAKVFSPSWPCIFFIQAKNIGMGPIVSQLITAKQGNHEFVSHITHPENSRIAPSWFWEPGEEKTLLFNSTENSPKDNTQVEAPPIRFTALLYDLFGRAIQIDYEWSNYDKRRVIEVSSVIIDGKKKRIPSLATLIRK